MKEHPILFNAEMVRAVLGGRKTQTRRLVKGNNPSARCQWQPHDRLWVRETWKDAYDSETGRKRFLYRADEQERSSIKWRPAIHMPREACRMVLEIVGVRMEYLLEIADDDAKEEGLDSRTDFLVLWNQIYCCQLGKRLVDNPLVWAFKFQIAELKR